MFTYFFFFNFFSYVVATEVEAEEQMEITEFAPVGTLKPYVRPTSDEHLTVQPKFYKPKGQGELGHICKLFDMNIIVFYIYIYHFLSHNRIHMFFTLCSHLFSSSFFLCLYAYIFKCWF